MTAGPVETRLAALVDTHMGWGSQSATGLHILGGAGVGASSRGDVKLNLREVLVGRGIEVDAALCQEVASALSTLDVVARARAEAPYVNLVLDDGFLEETVLAAVDAAGSDYGSAPSQGRRALVSYSNPNLNKPLHVGHLRNNLLGAAVAELIAASGYEVFRAQCVSDWGRHICQAIVAHEKWGAGSTPDEADIKGDHFVGSYYVMFHRENDSDVDTVDTGTEDSGRIQSALDADAAELLLAMEEGDPAALALNDRITAWAEAGMEATYRRIGTRFDIVFRESATRDLSRRLVDRALELGICRHRPDGSVYADLTEQGHGEVTLVRSDGTLVVYAQLLGSYVYRYEQLRFDSNLIVNGNHWTSGFAVIDCLLGLLGFDWVQRHDRVHYGMVNLPDGPMASRRGVVVHADRLLDEMIDGFRRQLAERCPTTMPEKEIEALAIGFVKHLFLRVPRNKSMLFDWETPWGAALDEYTLVLRTLALAELRSVLPEPAAMPFAAEGACSPRSLALHVNAFPTIVLRAAEHREPAKVLRFLHDLCTDVWRSGLVLPPGDPLWGAVAFVVRRALGLLNIDLPADLGAFVPVAELPPFDQGAVSDGLVSV
jgi:arginyl-tRNA synthetase